MVGIIPFLQIDEIYNKTMFQKGQISITSLIGWGLIIGMATISGIIASGRFTDNKVEVVKTEQMATVQRVAKLEEAVLTIKQDNAEIKRDIKELLRRIK